jgi:hypothetical protein
MKVICICNNIILPVALTIGKEYEYTITTKLFDDEFYCVIDDDGIEAYRTSQYFKPLDVYRNEKLEELGI